MAGKLRTAEAPLVAVVRAARTLVLGLFDAVASASAAPDGESPWFPRRPVWRVLAVVGWLVVSAGLLAGTISELVVTLRVPPAVAPFLGLVMAAPLSFAPARPLLSWRLMTLGVLLCPVAVSVGRQDAVWPWPVTGCVAMLLALALVGAAGPPRLSLGAGLLTVVAVFAFGHLAGMPFWIGDILAAGIAAGLVFGNQTGGRKSVQARLDEQRALRRQDLARQAVLEERGRIARELHDVVAHHMTMIAIQAEAAPLKVSDLPPPAAEIFAAINRAAREALAETRTVVGLLRRDDEAAERSPAPGLVLLDDLVARARGAGLRVGCEVLGVPRPLSAAVDVSAYRIIQEALSNASRYAPGSQVALQVHYAPDKVGLSVTNSAPAGPPAPGVASEGKPVTAEGAKAPSPGRARRLLAKARRARKAASSVFRRAGAEASSAPEARGLADVGGGHGLVGMRERVAMLGGTLNAGPLPDGGFAVTAELPAPVESFSA